MTSLVGRSNCSNPALRPINRLKRSRARFTSCRLTTIVALRLAASACTAASEAAPSTGSSEETGSSSRFTGLAATNMRAKPTRCRSPPDRRSQRSHSLSSRRNASSAVYASRTSASAGVASSERNAGQVPARARRAASTAWTTRWRGGSGGCCGARKLAARSWWRARLAICHGLSPPQVNVPRVGSRASARLCSSVVLPAPDGPISATCSPGSMVRSMSLIAHLPST